MCAREQRGACWKPHLRTELDAHIVLDALLDAARALVSRDITLTAQLVEEQARRSSARAEGTTGPAVATSDAAAQISAWFEDVRGLMSLIHGSLQAFSATISGGINGGAAGVLEFVAERVSIASQVLRCIFVLLEHLDSQSIRSQVVKRHSTSAL